MFGCILSLLNSLSNQKGYLLCLIHYCIPNTLKRTPGTQEGSINIC